MKSSFSLLLKISVSENEYKKKIGVDLWNELEKNTKHKFGYTCIACGVRAKESSEEAIKNMLYCHVLEENTENPLETDAVCLCKACHTTQHIDYAVKNEYVKLVNSTALQNQIIWMCRNNNLYKMLENRTVIPLKKTPQEFISELKSGIIIYDERLKVTFTDKFRFEKPEFYHQSAF